MRIASLALIQTSLLLLACTGEDVKLGTDSPERSRVLIGGTATPSPSPTESLASSSETSGPTPLAQSSAPGSCARLQNESPRGLACLHCTQPEAQQQAQTIRSVLLESCLRNVAINYLVDGTFSFDHQFLINEITELTSDGRRLFITFYLANGPAQRRYDITQIDSFGTQISPQEFRNRIRHDQALQGEYQRIVDRLVPVLRYANQRGASVSLVPVLDDNLDEGSLQTMLDLTLDVIPPSVFVNIGRNPCPGCFDGNSAGIPSGVFEELHTDWPAIGISGGLVSNDGRDYSSPASGNESGADTTLAELEAVRDVAGNGNNAFILWSAKRQGLASSHSSHPIPATRYYAPITPAERQELIDFLRG